MSEYHLGDYADIQNISLHNKNNQPMTNDLAFQVGYQRGIQDAADEALKIIELMSDIVESHDDEDKFYRWRDETNAAIRHFDAEIKRLLGALND